MSRIAAAARLTYELGAGAQRGEVVDETEKEDKHGGEQQPLAVREGHDGSLRQVETAIFPESTTAPTITARVNPAKMATPPTLGVGRSCHRSGSAWEMRPQRKPRPVRGG